MLKSGKMKIYRILFCIVLCLISGVISEDPGESCSQNGVRGKCTLLSQCQSVLDNPGTQWWKLHRCGTKDLEPIICCVGPAVTSTAGPVGTTPRLISTTEYSIPEYDYHTSEPLAAGCAAPALNVTPARTGRRAWDKCIEYQLELVYPCERGVALTQDMRRNNRCRRNTSSYISSQNTFGKHVVMLYRGNSRSNISWACSGTLLSDKFIFTIAFCPLSHRGPVTFARVGAPGHSSEDQRMYSIKRAVIHPEYKRQNGYDSYDVALLETESRIILDQWTIPACLGVFGDEASDAIEVTWEGQTDSLRKVAFFKQDPEGCRERYLPLDFNPETEICYGSYNPPLGPCMLQGSGGGPLLTENHRVHCMYSVVGLAASSAWCGAVPRKFTAISHLAPWIESVVWPSV